MARLVCYAWLLGMVSQVWRRDGEQGFLLHILRYRRHSALGFSITCQCTGERRGGFVARRTTAKRRGVESRFDDVAVGLSITCKYL
ncbi:hypothetical protein M430DRAFT_37406 [Amorphotheca resinae ATCC 22711]|uniref:Secreted protein n=1 Tax=Amorphotheca resinae ATCC 22711 TaxID=857342 RepID=A0A2T3AQP7_AMORE|nr:hypothetical protein M430DRAFT_37406 [Amorphotheca resinae ATCC 22711]PSS08591.1 hypothetical protein M430DRAFT_37406 [Amorphotheca resinae ATCC 22711]